MHCNPENPRAPSILAVCCTAAGLIFGTIGGHAFAQDLPPSEHKGITIEPLGVATEQTMKATLGLDGHVLQLRAITIEPGGQIARHDHATRPGIVWMTDGQWVEGRESGETLYDASAPEALIEDENTVHWIFNRGAEPGTALVCDIVPAS